VCTPDSTKSNQETPWGSDQKISLEPADIHRLVTETRIIVKALGDGIKRLYDSENLALVKLRKCHQAP